MNFDRIFEAVMWVMLAWGAFDLISDARAEDEFSPYGAETEVVRKEYGLWEEFEVEKETQAGVDVEFIERRDWWNDENKDEK